MNPELLRIILLYQSAVAELFPRLAKHLGVELPITNRDWTIQGFKQRGKTQCGIEYFIHGYGVALKHENIEVDFDLGDKGQIDGIDPWKIWYFLKESNISTTFQSSKEVELAVKTEVENGNMIDSGYMLYYLSDSIVTK